MSIKNKGFTVIELFMAVAGLAAFAVFCLIYLQNGMKESRDTVRESNVNNVAALIKIDRGERELNNYDLLKIQIFAIMQNQAAQIPKIQEGKNYFYGYSAERNDFFVAVCAERKPKLIVNGTDSAILAVQSAKAKNVCTNDLFPLKGRARPADTDAPTTSLDAYSVFRLI